MEARKKIAVVGSAPIKNDESGRIDSCDLVVRFNNCKVYGGHSGEKTDVLCINIGGAPARQMVSEKTVLRSRFYKLISELWIPADVRVCHEHITGLSMSDVGLADTDLSDKIIKSNELGHLPVVRFSAEFNIRVFELLKQGGCKFTCPSTGFFAIQYVLDEPRFAEWDKLVFGFTFKGWSGHPFEMEKKIVMQYAKELQNFTFVPSENPS